MVNGSRYLDKKSNGTPAYRRIGQTVLDKTTNINSGLKITDSQSGFRAFAAFTVPAFRFSKADFSIESEMLMDAASHDFKIMEVQVGTSYNKKQKGKIHTKSPLRHGFGVFVRLLRDMEFRRPLYYFTVPGLILILIGLILGLDFFGKYLDGQTTSLMPTVLGRYDRVRRDIRRLNRDNPPLGSRYDQEYGKIKTKIYFVEHLIYFRKRNFNLQWK